METKEIAGLQTNIIINNQDSQSIIILHGYGANKDDLTPLANFLDPHSKFNWYFPNAPLKLGNPMMDSRAWFPIDEESLQRHMMSGTHRDFKEDSSSELLDAQVLILDFVKEIDSKRKPMIGGFSQGAMLSTNTVLTKPNLFHSLIILSGNILNYSFWKKQINHLEENFPIFQSHGNQDPILSFEIAKELSEFLKTKSNQTNFHPFNGAHEIPMPILEKLKEFIDSNNSLRNP